MVSVETCGERRYTASKSDVPCGSATMTHWKEHLFFEPRAIVSHNFYLSVHIGLERHKF